MYLVAGEALGWLLLCSPLDQSFSYFAGTEFSLWIKPQPASSWQPWVICRAQMLLRYMSVYLKGSRSEKLSGRLILCGIWWELAGLHWNRGREIICTWECKPRNEILSVLVSSCIRWGTDIYIRGLWGLVVKDACEIVKYITDTHTYTMLGDWSSEFKFTSFVNGSFLSLVCVTMDRSYASHLEYTPWEYWGRVGEVRLTILGTREYFQRLFWWFRACICSYMP